MCAFVAECLSGLEWEFVHQSNIILVPFRDFQIFLRGSFTSLYPGFQKRSKSFAFTRHGRMSAVLQEEGGRREGPHCIPHAHMSVA
jgi:hypothetical protein